MFLKIWRMNQFVEILMKYVKKQKSASKWQSDIIHLLWIILKGFQLWNTSSFENYLIFRDLHWFMLRNRYEYSRKKQQPAFWKERHTQPNILTRKTKIPFYLCFRSECWWKNFSFRPTMIVIKVFINLL